MSKVPGWSTISGRFLKCGSVHTLMANITHNPLRMEGFSSEIQTQIKSIKYYKHEGCAQQWLSREV